MSDVISANRLRMIFALVVAAAMALGSLWVREVMQRGAEDAAASGVRTDPDYFVDNFRFVKTAPTGQARYSVTGLRMTHYPKDDSYEITQPVVKSLAADKPSVTMTAKRGTSNSDASLVEMFDDVNIDRPESAQSAHLHLSTDYMQFLPDDQVMQTTHAVEIHQGGTTMTGTGFYTNNATLVTKVSSKVHIVTQPHPH
ncbi:MAG TPA: LPS export ABC transporter periplasmic protein LptC [Burkholderiaceae bacterium]